MRTNNLAWISQQRGSILIITLLFLSIFSLINLSLWEQGILQWKMSEHTLILHQQVLAAESAIHLAEQALEAGRAVLHETKTVLTGKAAYEIVPWQKIRQNLAIGATSDTQIYRITGWSVSSGGDTQETARVLIQDFWGRAE